MSAEPREEQPVDTSAFLDDQDSGEAARFIEQHLDLSDMMIALSEVMSGQPTMDLRGNVRAWQMDCPLLAQQESVTALASAIKLHKDCPDDVKGAMMAYAQTSKELLERVTAKYWQPRGQTKCSTETQSIIDSILSYKAFQRLRESGFAKHSWSPWYSKVGRLRCPHLPGSSMLVHEGLRPFDRSWMEAEGIPMMSDMLEWVKTSPDLSATERSKIQSQVFGTLLRNAEARAASFEEGIDPVIEIVRDYGTFGASSGVSMARGPPLLESTDRTWRGDLAFALARACCGARRRGCSS